MLENANKYTDRLQNLFYDLWYDDKYKFYWNGSYAEKYEPIDSNAFEHRFVSVDNEGEILGYFAYHIDRRMYYAYSLDVINFTGSPNLIFSKDLGEVLQNIFLKYKFNKLIFEVVVGNPIEESYNKLLLKYGGRVVGVYKKHVCLIDGSHHDSKLYEILLEDYLKFRDERRE